jgi:hypothetical protein
LAYHTLIAALTGAAATELPQIPQARIFSGDYSGLVIKAFRRGSEDILCLWNNAATPRMARLRLKPTAAGDLPLWEHIRFAPAGAFLTHRAWASDDGAANVIGSTVAPLEFHILARTSTRGGFDWLAGVDLDAVMK